MNVTQEMICEDDLPDQSHLSPSPHLLAKGIVQTSTPATVYSTDSQSSPAHTTTTRKHPLPSPGRPRLDPRYASRLAFDVASFHNNNNHHSHFATNNNTTLSDPLMPPPTVQRSIFRTNTTTSDWSDVSSSSTSSDSFTSRTAPPFKKICGGDRFIPNRRHSKHQTLDLWDTLGKRQSRKLGGQLDDTLERSHTETSSSSTTNNTSSSNSNSGDGSHSNTNGTQPTHLNTFAGSAQRNMLRTLLRAEVLGENLPPTTMTLPRPALFSAPASSSFLTERDPTSVVQSFSLNPVSPSRSEQLVAAPSKRKRRISKVPFKVLDAPALQDDFYLNLVDWSSQNVLAVGLGSCVYLWSACTSKVTKLCDLASNEDTVTSVSWAQRGVHLSVGTNKGEVQLWDTIKCKKIRSMAGHSNRVGTLAWSGPILASGGRDRLIYLRDVRVSSPFVDKLSNHRQEVCGLRWSFEEPAFLASGGNDNNLHVIDSRNPNEPLHRFTEHTAAVKAIAWSPHQHGLLASGGGTADRCIRFWNTLSGASLNKIDTGSQVCNLAWSQNCNEIVSTHGYSFNQIVVWRYPSMSKVTTLTGHTYRVLYLSMSPDGSTIVTGAGDETLRFWQIFPGPRERKGRAGGLLFPNTLGSVIR